MARELLVLVLCAVGAFALATPVDVPDLIQRQQYVMVMYNRILEPFTDDAEVLKVLKTWEIEKNIDKFNNKTAAQFYDYMIDHKLILPRSVPYSPLEPAHKYETVLLFNVLYSAKDFETFYKTAVYLREIINQDLYFYTLTAAIFYRPDTQGLTIPPIYEALPSYFNYAEIVNTADKVKAFGFHFASYYPAISMFDNEAVINANEIFWPYSDKISKIKYFTNDYGLNAAYYFTSILYPYWLGKQTVPGIAKDRRGELWWFNHKQIVARYYLERLSAGLGEIPEITDVVPEGFNPGLVYETGIPYPSRPDDFYIERPEFAEELAAIKKFEDRLWDAIDQGYYFDEAGKKVSLLDEEGIDHLAYLVESNVDSPNSHYYKDYIRLWKSILGNSLQRSRQYHKDLIPLVVPSALENYQTALRDPAFYMLWKRVLRLFQYWQTRMPEYLPEELMSKGVVIEKVETDKLVTFFDKSHISYYPNFFKHEEFNVSVRYPRLNHKPFSVTVHAKSEEAKKVFVKFFLAPKYDSEGNEIPLHKNTENFFQIDQFFADLAVGENKIVRKSTASPYTSEDWWSTAELHEKLSSQSWKPTHKQFVTKFPERLLLPKGHADGFPLLLVTYIQDYVPPKVEFGSGYDRSTSYGLGSGSRFPDDSPLGFPANRPIYGYQAAALKNFNFQEVKIYHLDK